MLHIRPEIRSVRNDLRSFATEMKKAQVCGVGEPGAVPRILSGKSKLPVAARYEVDAPFRDPLQYGPNGGIVGRRRDRQ